MLRLMDKDFKLSIKISIFSLCFLLMISIIGILNKNQISTKFLYIIGIIMSVFIYTIYVNEYDNKYGTEKILNSLSINKNDIVVSKYITLVIYIFVSWSIMSIFTNLFKIIGFANGATVGIYELIIPFILCILYYSIYYPFYFKLREKARTANQIVWVLIFIFPAIMGKMGRKLESKETLIKIINKLSNVNFKIIILSIIIILLIGFYISCQISKKFYQKREF